MRAIPSLWSPGILWGLWPDQLMLARRQYRTRQRRGMDSMKTIGYYNGEYGLIEEVKIPMLDRGIYFGDGIYEATFSIGNKIFALDDHLDRLYSSASLIDINLPFTRT